MSCMGHHSEIHIVVTQKKVCRAEMSEFYFILFYFAALLYADARSRVASLQSGLLGRRVRQLAG